MGPAYAIAGWLVAGDNAAGEHPVCSFHRGVCQFHRDAFDLAVVVERLDALLAPVAAVFPPAERCLHRSGGPGVDEHLAGAQFLADTERARHIAVPYAGDESVVGVVGDRPHSTGVESTTHTSSVHREVHATRWAMTARTIPVAARTRLL